MPHSSVLLLTSTGLAQSLYLKLVNRVRAIVMNEIQFVSKSYLYPKLKSWLNLQRSSPFVGWWVIFCISLLLNLLPSPRPPKRQKATKSMPYLVKAETWAWSHDCTGHISTSHFSFIIAPFHWSHFSHHGSGPWDCQAILPLCSHYHIYQLTWIFTHMNLFLRPTLYWWSGSHLFAFRYSLSSPSSISSFPEDYYINTQISPT